MVSPGAASPHHPHPPKMPPRRNFRSESWASALRVIFAFRNAAAMRVCCGSMRNTHCVESQGKTAPVADVAAKMGGVGRTPPPGTQSVAATMAATSMCSMLYSLSR